MPPRWVRAGLYKGLLKARLIWCTLFRTNPRIVRADVDFGAGAYPHGQGLSTDIEPLAWLSVPIFSNLFALCGGGVGQARCNIRL